MKKVIGLTVASVLFGSGSAWADSQEEVNKQIAKLIGDAVSSRVATNSAESAPSQAPNNVWGSYSRLGVKAGGENIYTNIGVAGYDRDISSKVVVGTALSYSNTGRFDTSAWSVTPYIAYKFNDTYFAVLRAGYSDGSGQGTDFKSTSVAASINGLHKFDSLYGQWRVEIASTEAKASGNGFSSTTSMTAYIGDGELGYRFGGGLKGFVGLQASTTNQSNSYMAFARLGLEKELSKDAAINAKYETKVDDNLPGGNDFKINTFSIGARFRF